MSRRTVSDDERRARLALRHHLAPAAGAADAEQVTASLLALHATDPATVFLSVWARVADFEVADLEASLYERRSLVKHLAMRRTLFVFRAEDLPYAQGGASERVVAQERRRLIKEVEKSGLRDDGEAWLDRATEAVLEALAGGREATSTELREELELLEGATVHGQGKPWGGEVPVGPRVLTTMSVAGLVVRASNKGGWRTSRPRWARTSEWLGAEPERVDPALGTRSLVERWLAAFGPGTENDIKWWLGSTLTAVRTALAELEAVEVDLEGGAVGYLLPGDLETIDEPSGPWAALLPSLDPTVMGWADRDWYLGPHKDALFDRNGNAGHSVWLGGRIVGGWRQSPQGEVELQLLEDVGSGGLELIEAEAERLGAWLGGEVVSPRYPSPLSKRPPG